MWLGESTPKEEMRVGGNTVRNLVAAALLSLAFSGAVWGSGLEQTGANVKSGHGGPWKLTWSDEFNGKDGSAPDPAKWSVVSGGSGFGNNELEYDTARPENIQVRGGNLVITARKEPYAGHDRVARLYTSGRVQTKNLFSQQYGRFEARIKLPSGGQGIWPAFWMLGTDIDKVGWPACGEIDVMENVGFEPSKVHGSLHGVRYAEGEALTGAYTLPGKQRFSDAFHVFAAEWDPKAIRFYVDGVLYETQTPDNIPTSKQWAFDHPFYMLLDVAVGGRWPGSPSVKTVFPTSMLVDWVRVYRR